MATNYCFLVEDESLWWLCTSHTWHNSTTPEVDSTALHGGKDFRDNLSIATWTMYFVSYLIIVLVLTLASVRLFGCLTRKTPIWCLSCDTIKLHVNQSVSVPWCLLFWQVGVFCRTWLSPVESLCLQGRCHSSCNTLQLCWKKQRPWFKRHFTSISLQGWPHKHLRYHWSVPQLSLWLGFIEETFDGCSVWFCRVKCWQVYDTCLSGSDQMNLSVCRHQENKSQSLAVMTWRNLWTGSTSMQLHTVGLWMSGFFCQT